MTAGGWRNKALHRLETGRRSAPAATINRLRSFSSRETWLLTDRGDDRNPEEDYVTMAAGAGSARMQRAIRSDEICTLGGNCSTQRGCAKLQRGANEQFTGA